MQYQYREKGLCPAAVHADNLAGQIGALVAQMVNEVGNLLGLAQPSGRNFFYQVDQLVLLQPLDVYKRQSYGRYRFRVMDLKGHMPGMIGFYDEGAGIFFCGDHVLNKITPNIGYYKEGDHSLANYISNLKKIRNLPVTHVFPAHRGEIACLSDRVDEILEHHRERLDEITGVLSAKPMCCLLYTSRCV